MGNTDFSVTAGTNEQKYFMKYTTCVQLALNSSLNLDLNTPISIIAGKIHSNVCSRG